MKTINLKSDLSKFYGNNIRVEGVLGLISRPRSDKPRTVLLKDIHIDGKFVTDHMWVAYSNKWEDFSHKHANQKFTFVTKVIKIPRGSFTKYAFGKVTKLQLACVFKNPNQKTKPLDKVLINPDTEQLIPFLSAAGNYTAQITALATTFAKTEDKTWAKLTDIQIGDIHIHQLDIPLSDHQKALFQNSFPCRIEAKVSFQSDIHKILPYQPVSATRVKNLHLIKDK